MTHAISLNLIGAASPGDRVAARGQLDRRGGRVAFLSVVVTREDERGSTIVARAQVTKSIVRARPHDG